MRETRNARLLLIGGLIILLLLASFAGVRSGAVTMTYPEMFSALLAKGGWAEANDRHFAVIWSIRMPRVLLSVLAGASLGISGAALQGLFRNPMADPALIGVSAGGAAGAVLAGVLGLSMITPLAAIVGAFGATLLVYGIGRTGSHVNMPVMLLSGLAINALAGALIGFLIQLVDYESFRGITFWLLGSLGGASWYSCMIVALAVVPGSILLSLHARPLNALLLGESDAYHLGYDVRALQRRVILISAAMVGVVVAFCGAIGFLGLIVPHVVRMLLGPDHRYLLPASALAGATLLALADIAARTLDAPNELPVGVLTALLGAPFFLYLIILRKRRATA